MGYDMYWKNKPAEIEKQYEEKKDAAMAAAKERDEQKKQLSKEEELLFNQLMWGRGTGVYELGDEAVIPDDTPAAVKATLDAQREVSRLFDEAYAIETYYFRLNIWGMGLCREIMAERGMLDAEATFPGFPSPEKCGVTKDMFQKWDEAYGDEAAQQRLKDLYPELEVYLKKNAAALAAQREKPIGLPMFKLGSNDGWVVTPDECKAALIAHATYVDKNGEALPQYENQNVEWWPKWLDFLRGAIEHEGFEVF